MTASAVPESDVVSAGSRPAKPAVDELCWTVHPLMDESAGKTTLLVAAILAVSATAAVSFQSVAYGFLSFALLVVSMSRYFAPTRYTIGPEGAQVSHIGRRRRMAWGKVRRARVLRDGVFLSPFSRPSRLESFRGCFLAYGDREEEVVRFVRTHVPQESL